MNISFKKALFFLALILLLAGFLRFYKLNQQSFIADEYLGINIANGYNQTGKWQFWDFNQDQLTDETYTRANIYYWQVAKAVKLFGMNEATARSVSAIWGLISISLIFYLSYRYFKKPGLSLLAALLAAVSISALMFDRKLRMYAMFAPTYFLLSFLVYQFLEAKPSDRVSLIKKLSLKTGFNWYYFLPLLLVTFVSFNTHLLTINIAPTIAIYFIVMAIVSYRKNQRWMSKYFIFSVLSILGFGLILQNEQFRAGMDFSVFNFTYLEKVALDYSNYILSASVLVLGSYYLIKNHQKSGIWICLSFLMPLLLAIFVWHRNAGHQYIYLVQPFKFVLIAAGIFFLLNVIKERFDITKRVNIYFGLAVIYVLLVLINLPFFFSKDSYYEDLKKWSYPNYREAFAYYLKRQEPSDLLITRKLTLYYIAGSQSNILTYSQESPLTLDQIKSAEERYNRIWMIATKDMFIKSDADKYIQKNFRLIQTNYTNDVVNIWLWDKNKPNE